MSFQQMMKISGSALSAQRLRLDTISNNLANAQTTRTADGTAYQRQQVTFRPLFEHTLLQRVKLSRNHEQHLAIQVPASHGGVRVTAVTNDARPGKMVYEPSHPDADEAGYVTYPNVNVIEEMTDMISASRSYEASVTALQSAKTLALKALEIGRA